MELNPDTSFNDIDIDLNNLSDDALMNIVCDMELDDDMNTSDSDDDYDIEENLCISCKSNKIINDTLNGVIVCTSCGQIQDTILNDNPEWRSYADDNDPNTGRCSGPTNAFLPISSIGTTIGGNKRGRLQTLQSWTQMPYKEKSLYIVIKDIQAKCRDADILKCIEDDAKILYKNISTFCYVDEDNTKKNMITRGTNRRSLIAACVYFACKKNNKTRSAKEISQIFGLTQKDITRGCKNFMKLIREIKFNVEFKSSPPEDYVPRFCKELKLKQQFIDQAIKIAKNVQRINIATTHTPLSIATASILLTININDLTITKKHLASKFKVSEVTISKAYKSIEQYRSILIDNKKIDDIVNQYEKQKQDVEVPEALKNRLEKIKKAQCNRIVQKLIQDNNNMCDINIAVSDYIKNINIDLDKQINTVEHNYSRLI